MLVRVRLFAALRERAGSDELELELPDGALVADALDRIGNVTGEVKAVMAVNREYAGPATALHAGDELALIPPVSGGERASAAEEGSPGAAVRGDVAPGSVIAGGTVHVHLTAEPLRLDALLELIRRPEAGAVAVFEGVTREVAQLEYEAYEAMATAKMFKIASAARERHGLCAAAVAHRVGTVPLSEPSVVVAVSAAHRAEAFAGAREIIDRLKAEVPIWKREEGEWVLGELPATQS